MIARLRRIPWWIGLPVLLVIGGLFVWLWVR